MNTNHAKNKNNRTIGSINNMLLDCLENNGGDLMPAIPKPVKEKKVKKKRKKLPLQLAKTKAWNEFSKYIRLRDSKETQNSTEYANCCTCGKIYPSFGKPCLQAGHYIPGRRNANLFEETGCHAQCYNCNVNLKGNPIEYRLFMEKKYGWDEILRLESNNRLIKKYDIEDFKEITLKYKVKNQNIISGV